MARYAIFNKSRTSAWYGVEPKEMRTYTFEDLKSELKEIVRGQLIKQRINVDAIADALILHDKFCNRTITIQDMMDRVKSLHPEISDENTLFLRSTYISNYMYNMPTIGSSTSNMFFPCDIHSKAYLEVINQTISSTLSGLDDTKELIEKINENDSEDKWTELCGACITYLTIYIVKVH